MAVPAGSVEAYASWGTHGLGSEAFAVAFTAVATAAHTFLNFQRR
jgi:hypothetical protein